MTQALNVGNPREVVGGNSPPSPIEQAWSVYRDVSAWAAENPVVQSEDDARAAKLFFDRAKAALDDLEIARDGLVRPLNTRVKEINGEYKEASGPLDKLKSEIAARMRVFALAEEKRKAEEAAEARRVAEAAIAAALEAERLEREALENAAEGEFTDAGDAIAEADFALREAQVAQRAALRAEADVKARITGGFGRAFSLRTVETLSVSDAGKALAAIVAKVGSLPTKIEDALLSAARDYRKLYGALPAGIAVTHER